MSDEQIGATATEAAPAESAPAAQPADAAQTDATQAATTDTQATKPQINWDSDDNPHYVEARRVRDELAGTKGALKQLQQERAALRQQQDEMRREQAEAQRRWQDEQSDRQLQAILDQGDPDDPAVKALKAQTDEARRQRQVRQEALPYVQQQAQALAQQHYSQFLLDTAQDWGLAPEEVQAAHQKSAGDYSAFRKQLADQVREKYVGGEVAKVRSEYDAKIKAQEERLKALERGSQRSPDTNQGRSGPADDDGAFITAYATGERNSPADHQRANAYFARLRH